MLLVTVRIIGLAIENKFDCCEIQCGRSEKCNLLLCSLKVNLADFQAALYCYNIASRLCRQLNIYIHCQHCTNTKAGWKSAKLPFTAGKYGLEWIHCPFLLSLWAVLWNMSYSFNKLAKLGYPEVMMAQLWITNSFVVDHNFNLYKDKTKNLIS